MSENSALEAENERLLSKVPGGGGSRNGKASNPLGIKPSVPQTEVILLEFARSETKGFQDVKLQLVNSYVGNILKAGYVPTE